MDWLADDTFLSLYSVLVLAYIGLKNHLASAAGSAPSAWRREDTGPLEAGDILDAEREDGPMQRLERLDRMTRLLEQSCEMDMRLLRMLEQGLAGEETGPAAHHASASADDGSGGDSTGGPADAAPGIEEYFLEHPEQLRRFGIEEPASAPPARLVHALIGMAEDGSCPMSARYFAIRSLCRLPHRIGEATVRRLLADPSPTIRYCAVDLLCKTDAAATSALLELVLDDPNPHVQAAACRTAARTGYDKALPRILELMESGDPILRSSAEEALELLGRNKDVSSLLANLKRMRTTNG